MSSANSAGYYSYKKSPVKILSTPDGGVAAWRVSDRTGGWEPADEVVADIILDVGGEVSVRSREQFVQDVEEYRAYQYGGGGAIAALYETVNAIIDAESREDRYLTDDEVALVKGIRRKTFRMFEEKLENEGDPAADPSLAD